MPLRISASALRRIRIVALVFVPLLFTFSLAAPAQYGRNQSPIAINHDQVPIDPNAPRLEGLSNLARPLDLTVKNYIGAPWCPSGGCEGKIDERWASLKANAPASGAPQIKFNGSIYTLAEFHFHSPAEHVVNGRFAEMEIHFVFAREGASGCVPDQLLVIGRRIVPGTPSPQIQAQWDKLFGPGVQLPVNFSSPALKVQGFVISPLIVGIERTYRYQGSLTAPSDLGCPNPPGNPNQQLASGFLPQVVSWVLIADPILMKPSEILRLHKLFPNGDARGPQELLDQDVKRTF